MDYQALLYQSLVRANEEAFINNLFSVAYHVLSGAMYCAISLKDDSRLAEVEQIARSQLQELNAHCALNPTPNDPLELSLYTSLVQIVRTRRILFSDGNSTRG